MLWTSPALHAGGPISDSDIAASYSQFASYVDTKRVSFFKDCNVITNVDSEKQGGYVALVMKNEWMYNNLVSFFTSLNFTTKSFGSIDDFQI